MRKNLTIALLQGLCAGLLLLALLVSPVSAEAAPEKISEAQTKELREWFKALPAGKQQLLRRRLKALNKLTPEQQKKALEKLGVAEARVFTDEQAQSLDTLKKLSFVQRLRLHLLLSDLEMIKRRDPAGFESIMSKPGKERIPELSRRIAEVRLMRFMQTLPAEERAEFEKLPLGMRLRRYASARRERVQALLAAQPRYAGLKAASESGDSQARRELFQLTRDMGTLDDVLEAYAPAMSSEVRAETRGKVLKAIADGQADKIKPVLREIGETLRKNRKPRPDEKSGDFSRRPMIAPERERKRGEK